MELPRALRPWSAQLAIFPAEIAFALAPLVQRIAVAIGPLHFHGRHGDGEPEGFDGLARRGPYDRLLASEWLLADEVPDEFLRRALMGEQTFLQLARKETFASKLSVALFDAGPSQLGGPRLAHLAALVVLARRAEAERATFRWGILQEPAAGLFDGLTPSNVLGLLDGRRPDEATEAQLDAWRESTTGAEDRWIVGSGEPAGAGSPVGLPQAVRSDRPGFRRLLVDDVLEPSARAVTVRVDRGRATHETPVRLELPSEANARALLRDPFAARTGAPAPSTRGERPASNVVFATEGQKIFARSHDGRILDFPLSSRPLWPRLHGLASLPVVAASWSRKAAFLLSLHGDKLEAHWFRGSERLRSTETFEAEARLCTFQPAADPATLLPCWPLPRTRTGTRPFYALDGDGQLFRFEAGVPSILEAVNVTAAAPTRDGLRYIGRRPGPPGEHDAALEQVGEGSARTTVLLKRGGNAAFFGYQRLPADLVAYQEAASSWCVRSPRGSFSLTVTKGEVVGVTSLGHRPGLVVKEPDGRTLSFMPSTLVRETLLEAEGGIREVALSPVSPHLVSLDLQGDLGIFSLRTREHIFRTPKP